MLPFIEAEQLLGAIRDPALPTLTAEQAGRDAAGHPLLVCRSASTECGDGASVARFELPPHGEDSRACRIAPNMVCICFVFLRLGLYRPLRVRFRSFRDVNHRAHDRVTQGNTGRGCCEGWC